MRKLWLMLLAFAGFVPLAETQDKPPFPTGAQRTSFAKIVESIKTGKATILRAATPPPQVIVVPKKLSYWGNNRYGDCVTVESCFAIASYSCFLGLPEIFVTEQTCINWANSHGWLNGAPLLDVIQDMQRDGIMDEGGKLRKAGQPSSVDYRHEDVLKTAIAQGPVSVAIDSSALPSGAGSKSGWYAFGGRSRPNTDHCVCIHSYGPTSELFKALGVAMPANAPANGYLVFTWSTIGVVDHPWILSTVVEAWVRNPTVTELPPPPPPTPIPTTVTVAVPNVAGVVGVPVKFSPTASGGVSPYLFLFEYGDGSQDASGQHTYNRDGVFAAKVIAVDSKGSSGSTTCMVTIGAVPPGPTPPTPDPQPIPVPGKAGTIQWTINGVTSQYELMPIGTRQKILDLIGPMAP